LYRALCHEDDIYNIQTYLVKLPDYLLLSLSGFRLGRNKFPGVIGRNKNLDFEDRCCKLCNDNLVGDEFHYLLECPTFAAARLKYLGRYYCHNPSMIKFSSALRPTSIRKMIKLAQFCGHIIKNTVN